MLSMFRIIHDDYRMILMGLKAVGFVFVTWQPMRLWALSSSLFPRSALDFSLQQPVLKLTSQGGGRGGGAAQLLHFMGHLLRRFPKKYDVAACQEAAMFSLRFLLEAGAEGGDAAYSLSSAIFAITMISSSERRTTSPLGLVLSWQKWIRFPTTR